VPRSRPSYPPDFRWQTVKLGDAGRSSSRRRPPADQRRRSSPRQEPPLIFVSGAAPLTGIALLDLTVGEPGETPVVHLG
jgi:hypothetical protein